MTAIDLFGKGMTPYTCKLDSRLPFASFLSCNRHWGELHFVFRNFNIPSSNN